MVIGVFTAQLDDAYQRRVWSGIAARAEETGHGLVCFVGQRLDAPAATEAARNVAYHLADRENIDGLIVLSSTIGIFRGIEGVRSLLAQRDVPWVSLGVRLPLIPSVTADGTQAMAELVRHLIRCDRRRRIALLAGPAGHPEAEEREKVFRDELAAAGIAFDERLLVRGTFLSESGEEGARSLLARGIDFDAVVCLNDRMAMGAMTVFREAGVRIPTDVAVTGFDDISEARWTSPPLTTVAQPLEVLGRTAVDMILALLSAHSVQDRLLTCNLVTRQSCGCPPARRTASLATESDERRKRLEYLIPTEMKSALRENRQEDFLNSLNVALLASVSPLRSREETETDEILESWHAALQESAGGTEADVQLYSEAQALVSSVEIRAQATARIEAFEQDQLIRSLSASLAGSFGMETMISQLSAGLQRLGIRSGYLVLFSADEAPPRKARLIMAYPAPSPASDEETADFEAKLLLPRRYLPRFDEGVWILEPLAFQDEALGYLILEGTHRDPAIFENLRDQVSSTLKGSLLMEKITGHEQELEIEVLRRTQELRKANLELISLLAQRRALEREVQEISDKTMQTIGQDLHDDLCQNLAGISMFVSLLESELKEQNPALVESAARVRRMLEDSISRTRRIARGLYPPGLEERGLVATLEDLFDSVTRTGKVTIGLQVAPSFPSLAPALALQVFRIIQEAVSNAIRHSGTDHIDVRLRTEEGRAWAEIQDFGCGLEPLSHGADDQGMGLRIMRYRAESIGAELTIDKLAPGFRIACSWDDKALGDSHE